MSRTLGAIALLLVLLLMPLSVIDGLVGERQQRDRMLQDIAHLFRPPLREDGLRPMAGSPAATGAG